jgi:hypothetical protein
MDNDDDDDARLHEHVVCADNRGADSVTRDFTHSDVVVTNHVPGGIDGHATRASRRGCYWEDRDSCTEIGSQDSFWGVEREDADLGEGDGSGYDSDDTMGSISENDRGVAARCIQRYARATVLLQRAKYRDKAARCIQGYARATVLLQRAYMHRFNLSNGALAPGRFNLPPVRIRFRSDIIAHELVQMQMLQRAGVLNGWATDGISDKREEVQCRGGCHVHLTISSIGDE